MNDRGSFFLNIGDTFDDGNLQNIPHRVVIGLQEKGWVLRNTIIWNKTNPKPSSSKTNLTSVCLGFCIMEVSQESVIKQRHQILQRQGDRCRHHYAHLLLYVLL